MNKQYKYIIYWCDDEFALKVQHPVYQYILEEKGIQVKDFSKSDDLLAELQKPNCENHVDAVIFDFNMSNISDGRAESEEKSGFLDILRVMNKYVVKGIPFYLWSKMDFEHIRSSLIQSADYKRELDILDSYINEPNHKRWFDGENFKGLIDTVLEEIEESHLPQSKLRFKFPEAYEAAISISQKCWDDIVAVLTLTPESEDWNRMENLINPIRNHVEKMMKELEIPSNDQNEISKFTLASLGHLISGRHADFEIHSALKDEILGYGVYMLMSFLNDGSHQKAALQRNVREYIISKKDEHLLYFIAHSFINLLIWANKARLLKEDVGEICFPKVKSLNPQSPNSPKTDGLHKLELDKKGFLHIGDCQITNLIVGKHYQVKPSDRQSNKTIGSPYPYFLLEQKLLNK